MREGLTLHSDGNCRLFHFKKEAWKFCRISLPRYLVLCWQIPGRQVHFIKSLTSYCRCVVTCYKNAPNAGSHTVFCDVLMSTYHCALVRYEVMPAETARSAEWLRAVCTATISQSGGIQIFARSQRENSVSDSLCPQSNIYRRESISKDEDADCRIFLSIVSTSGILTYLLTPWCRALLEKLTGLQLVKKFPAFHGTRRFITALISVCHLSVS